MPSKRFSIVLEGTRSTSVEVEGVPVDDLKAVVMSPIRTRPEIWKNGTKQTVVGWAIRTTPAKKVPAARRWWPAHEHFIAVRTYEVNNSPSRVQPIYSHGIDVEQVRHIARATAITWFWV